MNPSVLQRIASGDSAAVRDCIEQYGALVWSLARRLSRSPSDAEDATQEIFLDIWRSAGRFDAAQGSDKVFIAMIARRRLIDRLRKTSAEPPMDPVETLEAVAWADPGTASETCARGRTSHARTGGAPSRAAAGIGARAPARPDSIRDRGALADAAGNGEIIHAARSHQSARIYERRRRRRLERGLMSERGPQDQPDEAMVDLLIKQVTDGLSPAEQRALDVLDSAVVSAHLRDFERAAAAIALAGSANAPPLPPDLAQRVARQAEQHFGAVAGADKPIELAAARSAAAARAPAAAPRSKLMVGSRRRHAWCWPSSRGIVRRRRRRRRR